MEAQRISPVNQAHRAEKSAIESDVKNRTAGLFLCNLALSFGVQKHGSRVFAQALVGITLFFAFAESLKSGSNDDFWDGQFGVPGAAGWGVSALAFSDGKLFVSGSLISLGGITVTNIGCWDGTNWSALGTGVGRGLGEGASALAVARGSVYAGGYFPVAGGSDAFLAGHRHELPARGMCKCWSTQLAGCAASAVDHRQPMCRH